MMYLGLGEKEYIMRHTRPRGPSASRRTGIKDCYGSREIGKKRGRIGFVRRNPWQGRGYQA